MKKIILKIGTLNFQSGVGVIKGYWQYPLLAWKYLLANSTKSIKKVSHFIHKEDIDILGVIEINNKSIRTLNRNQAELISEGTKLKEKAFFSDYEISPFVNYGNALVSKYPIIKQEKIKIFSRLEPRYLANVKIRLPLSTLEIFLVHLSVGKKDRTIQIRQIAKIVKKIKGPSLIMGDFNTFSENELSPFISGGFKQFKEPKTYPSWNPKVALDHILVKSANIKRIYAYKKKLFSDHLPLVAEIEI